MDKNEILSRLPDSAVLNEINIAGTHDSSTQYISMSPISRCQNLGIRGQLEVGSRALDIRIRSEGSEMNLIHGVCYCRKGRSPFSGKLCFSDVLGDCRSFLEENPRECILMVIQLEKGNSESFLESFDKNVLAKYPQLFYLENRMPRLGEVRGKIVLIRRFGVPDSERNNYGIDFTGLRHQGSRKSSEALSNEIYPGLTLTVQDRYMHMTREKWSKAVKPFLETAQPDEKTVILNCLSTAGSLNPHMSAKYINRRFVSYAAEGGKVRGWILADFITHEVCESIYAAADGSNN